MMKSAVVYSSLKDSDGAGISLGLQIRERVQEAPDVVITFISPFYEQQEVLKALKETCGPKLIVGCGSSGEFTSQAQGVNMACAVAIRSDEMHFTGLLGEGLFEDQEGVARKLAHQLTQTHNGRNYPWRTGLVLMDALYGSPERLLELLTDHTSGQYQFFGGGAGDNMACANTPVFYDTQVHTNAVVVLGIHSQKPLGIGICHNWVPASSRMVVTETDGRWIKTIDNMPALEVFLRHAYISEQEFDLSNPMTFLIQNLLGFEYEHGYKLRGVLQINQKNGSLLFGDEIPVGARIRLMNSHYAQTVDAVKEAGQQAIRQLGAHKPAVALFFDCPASRYKMGDKFVLELEAVQHAIGDAAYAGCNSHGQVARIDGQFHGYFNCTPLICIFPE